jgi:phosphate transport system permease protein
MSEANNQDRGNKPERLDRKAVSGEPMVWLSGMGLAIGLLLIIGLLGVIVWHGVPYFWPKRVVEVTVTPDTQLPGVEAKTFNGELRMQRLKADGVTAESQFYLGNRDIYGFSFKFLNDSSIEKMSYPQGLISIEREEYGGAIGYPVKLVLGNGSEIPAESDGFDGQLEELIDEVSQRRKDIKKLAKHKIGKVNDRLAELKFEEIEARKEYAEGSALLDSELGGIEEERAKLEATYLKLEKELNELYEEQEKDSLVYRLASGQETEMTLGKAIDFHYPNRLSFLERCLLFLSKLWVYLSEDPREANTEGGVFPAIFGTFVMTLLMSILVTPLGVIAAIYLREYARQGLLVRSVRISVNNLAGVPSIVFGVFGLGFFIYIVGDGIDNLFFKTKAEEGVATFKTGGMLWASLTLALMTIPVVVVATEEALAAVPRGMREASLACGGSKWQTIQRIVLPAALPGIITGLVLAMARGAGEVAPLMLVGVVESANELPVTGTFPFIHMDQKFMHLGFQIYDLGFQSPDSEAARPIAFATALLLIVLVVVLNLAAIIIRQRLRRKYISSTF